MPPNPPMTEAQIAAVSVGGGDPAAGRIEIAEYDPHWPAVFAAEAAAIRSALGPAVLALEHVGSTSVPGLAAKPVIDIVLGVADPAAEHAYLPALGAAGYRLRVREPDWFEHRMLRREIPTINLHVFALDCPEVERMRRLRDWLRDHPDDRRLYEAAKRSLAAQSWRHVQQYADAKSGVLADILGRANIPDVT